MKALIDPTSPVSHIVSWTPIQGATEKPFYTPVLEVYPNSARVCQVEPDDQTFSVAEPLFWTDCANNVVADQFWYDTSTQIISVIVNSPVPTALGLTQDEVKALVG